MKIGQIINIVQTILTVILGAIPVILVNLGCVTDAAGNFNCANAIIAPGTLAWIGGGVLFIKTVVLPWLAPGGWIRNLFGERAVVAPSASPAATEGTVPPTAVR